MGLMMGRRRQKALKAKKAQAAGTVGASTTEAELKAKAEAEAKAKADAEAKAKADAEAKAEADAKDAEQATFGELEAEEVDAPAKSKAKKGK